MAALRAGTQGPVTFPGGPGDLRSRTSWLDGSVVLEHRDWRSREVPPGPSSSASHHRIVVTESGGTARTRVSIEGRLAFDGRDCPGALTFIPARMERECSYREADLTPQGDEDHAECLPGRIARGRPQQWLREPRKRWHDQIGHDGDDQYRDQRRPGEERKPAEARRKQPQRQADQGPDTEPGEQGHAMPGRRRGPGRQVEPGLESGQSMPLRTCHQWADTCATRWSSGPALGPALIARAGATGPPRPPPDAAAWQAGSRHGKAPTSRRSW